MPQKIFNPNREMRLACFMIIGIFFAWGVYIVIAERIPVLLFLIIPFVLIVGAAIATVIPYMIFCKDGIMIRRFWRNRMIPWSDVLKVEVNLVNPTKSDLSIRYSIRVRLRDVRFPISAFFSMPLYSYLKTYYGTLDSDDIAKLNSWERKCYHLDEEK